MENLYKLMDVLADSLQELDTIKVGRLKMGELEAIDKITHSMKSTLKILEDCGYSQAGDGGYNDGNSYANRGEHWVRGHFSRDNGRMAARRDDRGRYSRGGGKERMLEQLRDMKEDATTERQRSAISRCMEQLENE